MTKEEKQLLLKVLCAGLPYGIKILDIPANVVGELYLISTTDMVEYEPIDEANDDNWTQTLYNIKPYLRPMLSMTEEERQEYRTECKKVLLMRYRVNNHYPVTDWLNAHHFDYRGLIPMGLALEAKKGMYKTE